MKDTTRHMLGYLIPRQEALHKVLIIPGITEVLHNNTVVHTVVMDMDLTPDLIQGDLPAVIAHVGTTMQLL